MSIIRVVIADPDESLLAAYRDLLRDDLEVVAVANAMDCVARLRHFVPDVLVLEPCLPWGGGDGVLSVMRDDPGLANVPVMILTACRDPRILKSVAPFPICDYRVKPLLPTDLAARIRRLLDHRRRRMCAIDQATRLQRWNARRTQEPIFDY